MKVIVSKDNGFSMWIQLEAGDDVFDLADQLIEYARSYLLYDCLSDSYEDQQEFRSITNGLNCIINGNYCTELSRLNRMIDFAYRYFHGVTVRDPE